MPDRGKEWMGTNDLARKLDIGAAEAVILYGQNLLLDRNGVAGAVRYFRIGRCHESDKDAAPAV
jgi:hypothetical protein